MVYPSRAFSSGVGPGSGGREKSPLTSLGPRARLAKVVPVREGEVTARSEAKEITKKREKKKI